MTTENRRENFELLSLLDPKTTMELADALDKMGFFTAPASTKYHGSCEGGLYDHCLSFYTHLMELTRYHNIRWSREASPFIVAFLHDICKCDQYLHVENGYSYNNNTLLTGHGEKSVMLCNLLPISLTEEEMVCIRYHMGAFVDQKEWSAYTNAIHKYPTVLWTHTADMMAAHIDMT